ncbi:unnamed protein product [Phytophthora fragariaefolia]|uniref:Unnamed protein product n=1 Tax=Phytophthora fragariaefolia TaxID=1490495 RepID=A0A9W7CZ65_9STRA|nr:unnamed protein product [Phytophthora fragariaefolia]
MPQLHARQWGYRAGPHCKVLSLWAPSDGRSAGVAILIHTKSRFIDPEPIFQEYWTDRFMALTGKLEGEEVIIFNCYAPNDKSEQDMYFTQLQEIPVPEDVKLFVGGDFNCTLNERCDRSYQPLSGTHDSPALRGLMHHWRLIDSVANHLPGIHYENARWKFYDDYHRFQNHVDGVGLASSRLDRWYTNDESRLWVMATALEPAPIPTADHSGVLLHIQSPENANAESPNAAEAARCWDEFKAQLIVKMLLSKTTARRKLTNTYRQKIRRLEKQRLRALASARHEAEDRMGAEAHDTLKKVDIALAECRRERSRQRQRRLFRDHTWTPGKTTKKFFSRISCKFSDNVVPSLRPPEGCPVRGIHEKSETFADAWAPIQQGAIPSSELYHKCLTGCQHNRGTPTADNNFITEEAVSAASKECKADQSCGPDRLGNDWYIDFAEMLIPVLTRLYTLWYKTGAFPASFVEANIFCLKKTGDSSNPLNYCPLALLNTDYKIITRMISTKVEPTLATRIHPNQNGFVPGRQIHDTIDLYTVAKRMASTIPELRHAIAVFLDFAKAYDSLFREFMCAVLIKHGYPPHFVKVIAALHTGSRIRFLVNGQTSRTVDVVRGIRQGCPLAPDLFILTLEPLYQMVETSSSIRGVQLRSATDAHELKVGGFADDTASYLQDASYMSALLHITTRFGQASGLIINESKTIIISLNDRANSTLPPLPVGFHYQPASETASLLSNTNG